jgi:hypothetical protein
MASQSSFKAIEERLDDLKRRRDAYEISPAEFRQQLLELHLTVGGQEWQLGVAGQWTKLEGEEWVAASPPTEVPQSTPQPEDAESITEPTQAADLSVEEQEITPPPAEAFSPESDKPMSPEEEVSPPRGAQWARSSVIGGLVVLVLLLGAVIGGVIWLKKPSAPPAIVVNATDTPSNILPITTTDTPIPTMPPTHSPVLTDTPTAIPTSLSTDTLTPSPTATLPPSPTFTVAPSKPTATPRTPPPSIAFTPVGLLAYPAFNTETNSYDVYVQRLETGQVIRTIKNASQPDISPSGIQIVYRSWQSDRLGLIVENLDGSELPWFASTLFEASRPVWNASSSDLIFAANNLSPNQWDIYFSGDRPGRSGGLTPAWFSDGRIVYQGDIEGQYGLVLADPNTGQGILLTNSTQDFAPAPTSDGSHIVFMSDRDGTWDLYLLDVGTRQVTRLTNDAALDTSPIWSPDGRRIAFVSNRDGRWAIWTMLSDGSDPRQLLSLPGSFDGKVAGVPDYQQTGWRLEHISWVE